MNEEEFAEIIRNTQKGDRNIPSQHPLMTPNCPSMSRMVRAIISEDWTSKELLHIEKCVYCQKFIPIAKKEAKNSGLAFYN